MVLQIPSTFFIFFGEAGNAVNIETKRPALEVGDIVVMDNCPTHHYAGGEALTTRVVE